MSNRFSGKVALVTGSSNGIGRGTAILFAQEGAKVTITGRNTQRLEETKQEILKAGIPEDHVLAIATDLATEEGQDELINKTIKKFGRLDILVNNAGAAFNDEKGQPTFLYYAMSKAALDQYTRSAAIDLIQHGVRVNSVSPGAVVTGFGEAMGMPSGMHEKYEHFMETHKECIPYGAIGKPIDIAHIIAFLADRKLSSYIIGQTIVADGGSSLVMGMQAHDMMDILKS
ncbi:hypothetical protein L3Y34_007058 [Caenorhabditis briggsae]|uniref:Uncharacterized protein n=1 Tax=Caenorhabditis briggsae TaxID=6238 RepID=A0AAE8ZYV3_CAEBR|nr:hypothetical protein L3Y34_007058 [Caenorhabditis briggsae]